MYCGLGKDAAVLKLDFKAPLVNVAIRCPRTAAGGLALTEFESLKDFHYNNPLN